MKTHTMRRHLSAFSALGAAAITLAALTLSDGAHAFDSGAIKDPTVPPAAWLAVQQRAPGEAPRVGAVDTSGVRVILLGKTRRLALVDGQVVSAGDIRDGSKVLGIKLGEVVVEDEAKSLKIAPGVEKKFIKPVARKKPARTMRGSTASKSTANRNETGNGSSQ